MNEIRPSADHVSRDPLDRSGGRELSRLIGVLSESRWLIAGVTASVFVLGVLYSLIRTPVYEADIVLHVLSQQSGGLSGLENLSALVQGAAIPTETEIELLQTRAVLVPVIRKLHLDIDVGRSGIPVISWLFGSGCKSPASISSFNVPQALEDQPFTIESIGQGSYRLLDPDGDLVLTGMVGKPAAGRVATGDGFGIANLQIDFIDSCAGSFSLARVPIDKSVASLLANLSIQELGQQTGVVSVSMRGPTARSVADRLNAIADSNVELNISQNSAQAARQLGFLDVQLPDLERRLEAAQTKLAQFLSGHRTLAALSQDTQYLIEQAAALEQQIGPLRAQAAMAKASLGFENPKLRDIGAQLQALESQRSELLANIAKLPQDEQTLVRLQSDVTTNQNLYASMLNQSQALQVAKAGAVGDVAIVDPAVVPSDPVAPNKPLDAVVGLFLGALLGVMAAFGRRAVRQGIEDPELLDERLGLPVFAVLAHSAIERRLSRRRTEGQTGTYGLLAARLSDQEDLTMEGLRSLRTALQLALPNAAKRVLCVTSLGPGEGKSFVSSNLAYLFAVSGLRVLLVDADLRRGHLHRAFGWPRGNGLADVLEEKIPIEAATQKTQLEKLDVMTTGTRPADAASLLVNVDLGGLLNKLASRYELVIVDVPPLLAVSDAFVIARHGSLNVLLIKHGLHSLRQVRLVLRRLARHDIKLAGCILNDVSSAAQRYAYREFGYQYQYRYK